MKRIIFLITAFVALSCGAQTSLREIEENPLKAGGVYYAYPITVENMTAVINQAPVPKGYEPFYVSHYGRHGSRYLISDNDYRWVIDKLQDARAAGALSSLGEDVLNRLEKVWEEAEGRGGDLTPLGVRQHKAIAGRLAEKYPQIFKKGDTEISARSTTVIRCVLSMDAFCERLKELNPKLNITRESSQRYMDYLNYHSTESNAFTGEKGLGRRSIANSVSSIQTPRG